MTVEPPLDWRAAGIGPDAADPVLRVTRDNWRLYPFVRWSFQHARELVPSRGLPPARRKRILPRRSMPLARMQIGGGDWGSFLASGHHDAVLVLHRGAIVFEHYANNMGPRRPHMLFSITKSIVGLVAEALIAAGAIREETRAAELVPELAGSAFAGASLRDLLDMTDGAAFDETYGTPDAEVHLYSRAFWTPAAGLGGVRAALPRIAGEVAEPGTRFAYRTPVADVVGWMLARASGARLADLVAQHVWHPAGCGDEAYMLVDTAGHEIAGTGFNASPEDMARLALWLMRPANAALRARIMRGGDRALFAAAHPESEGESYRSFWWLRHTPEAWLTARGVYGQRLWIDPADQIAIICLASWPRPDTRSLDPGHDAAFLAIAAALRG